MPERSVIPAVAIVVSRYNASVTDRLLDGALDEHRARGGAASMGHVLSPQQILALRAQGPVAGVVDVFPAAGAFELPGLCAAAAKTGRYGAVVALGCLIKGETMHDRVIADAVARGLTDVAVQTGVPVVFGLLTVDTREQAMARAGGPQGNKGREAMAAAIETALTMAAIKTGTADPWRAGDEEKRPDKAGRGG